MATSWTNDNKNATTWDSSDDEQPSFFLLKEDAGFLLTENSDLIILSRGTNWINEQEIVTAWTNTDTLP